jgi:hypothetical protein
MDRTYCSVVRLNFQQQNDKYLKGVKMSHPYPGITFIVDLPVAPQIEGNLSGNLGFKTEVIGPNTNSRAAGGLHPDAYQSSPDNGRFELANRPNTRSANIGGTDKRVVGSIPGPQLAFSGIKGLKNGDVITLWGEEALEIRKKFAAGPWNDNQPTGGLGAILIEIAYGDEVPNP